MTIKYETAGIHFLSDEFSTIAVVIAFKSSLIFCVHLEELVVI